MDRRVILHLCADTGSDSWPYRMDPERYQVIRIGSDIGVENYVPDRPVHGVIANPVCTEFSAARRGRTFGGAERPAADPASAVWMALECQRIIRAARPVWHVMENPATGTLRDFLGPPAATYEPWHYGSPWTKRTALWGSFTMPPPTVTRWDDVILNPDIYVRPGRRPSMVWLHRRAFYVIPEFRDSGMPPPRSDAELRSLCSQKFAHAFKAANP